MATYNVQKSAGGLAVAIADAASPDTQTDLQLVGQNAVSYGLDVAQSFYFLLENFANDTAPANKVTGELWYDITAGALTLKVWNGTTWDSMAPLELGSTEGALARWNDSTKTWLEDTQVTLIGGVFGIAGSGSGQVTFAHDNTDFNIVGDGATTDLNVTGVAAVNMPSLTLVTALAEIQGGTGTATYTTGDILYSDSSNSLTKLVVGTNGDVLTLAAGVPSWVAGGAGVTDLDSLSDVTASGAGTEGMLYKSAGDWLVSTPAQLGWDNGSQDLTVANLNGIAAVNLITRLAPGTLASTTFSGDILTSNADISLGDNDQVIFGSGNDVRLDFDATDFVIDGFSAAADFNIINFTDALRVDTAIYSGITGSGGGEIKVLGTTNSNSTNEGFVSVNHNDDGQTQVRMGTRSGSSFSEVNALVDDLNLYAANTLVFNIDPTQTTVTENTVTAAVFRNSLTTNNTTSVGVTDNNAEVYNAGYNETDTIVIASAIVIDNLHIGKFLTRTGSTSRTVTLNTDADIPTGASCLVHNGASGGTLTIVPGTITTLTWIDGSGTTPGSATRTLANNSICTLRRVSTSVWQIWGNGIS